MARIVIVGAGSAGMIAAWRLSEDPTTEVVLIEAGADPSPRVPDFLRRGVDIPGRYYWDYHDADDGAFLPRGKVVGGSSAVNYAGATRSSARSYDDWGLPGWSFADCLPAFRAIETDLDFGDSPDHGGSGPIPVVRRAIDEADAPLVEAYRALGHTEVSDHNAADAAAGFGPFPSNLVGADRASTLVSLLPILRERPNVTVRADCPVHGVQIRDGVAVGVRCGGPDPETVEADQVLLAAGTYGTPEILVASGIGPADALKAAHVPVVVASEDVGRHLREHPQAVLNVEAAFPVPPAHPLLLTTACGEGAGQIAHVFPFRGLVPGLPETMVSFVCAPLAPTSTGHLDLGHGRARVHRCMVDTEADRAQLHTVVDQCGVVIDELARRGLVTLPEEPLWRLPHRRRPVPTSLGYNHPVGTCRMGADERSVTDLELRVRGVDRLMIADASVMPDIPRSQTNFPTMMIGYRGAEFLLARL